MNIQCIFVALDNCNIMKYVVLRSCVSCTLITHMENKALKWKYIPHILEMIMICLPLCDLNSGTASLMK